MNRKGFKTLEVVSLILLSLLILMLLTGWQTMPDTIAFLKDQRGHTIISGSRYLMVFFLAITLIVYAVTQWLKTSNFIDQRLETYPMDSLTRYYKKERILYGILTLRCELLVLISLLELNIIARVNVTPSVLFMMVMFLATLLYEKFSLKNLVK